MSELAAILGAYAAGHGLEHGGKVYTFGRIDQARKAALTARYYRRAREAVYAMREEMSEAEYNRALDGCREEWRAGAYDFPMGESLGYFLGAGLAEFVEALTGCTAEEALALAAGRGTDATHLALCVVTESFPDLKKKLLLAEEKGMLEGLSSLAALIASPPPG
jgi:hypothetical protein